MTPDLKDLHMKQLAFHLVMKDGTVEPHLIIRLVAHRNNSLMIIDDDMPPPFTLPLSWIERIQAVPADSKATFGGADFYITVLDTDAGSAFYKGLKRSVVQKNFGK